LDVTVGQGCEFFLRKFHNIVHNGRLDIIPRAARNETIQKLGLTKQNVKEILLELISNDYSSGPKKDDRNPNNQIWIFGKTIDGIEIYIKLTIAKIDKIEIAKCISFHETMEPLRYPKRPFRGNKGES
jgi:hypothetical protein